jgi:hypothetical protein
VLVEKDLLMQKCVTDIINANKDKMEKIMSKRIMNFTNAKQCKKYNIVILNRMMNSVALTFKSIQKCRTIYKKKYTILHTNILYYIQIYYTTYKYIIILEACVLLHLKSMSIDQ